MALFRPPALALVRALARAGVRPEPVVVCHCLLGLAAAALVATSSPTAWLVAAALLQLKTVLDNADGALARSTDTVTELGRYLDTVLDFVVNVALFAALAAHGPWALSALALVVLTLVLSWDFNSEWLYKAARSGAAAAPGAARAAEPIAEPIATEQAPGGGALLHGFRGFYQVVFEPQDRLVRRLDTALFRLAGGSDYAPGSPERAAWSDMLSTAALVDLGLSTQLLALGGCLALGRPFLYVYLVLLQGAYLLAVQVVRVLRFRRFAGPSGQGRSA